MLHKLVTPEGWTFYYSSKVSVKDRCYDMDDLTDTQKKAVWSRLELQGLNAAFAGKATFQAADLAPLQELFPGQEEIPPHPSQLSGGEYDD